MTIEAWLEAAEADARQRDLAALVPLLGTLAAATTALRAADWNDAADADETAGGEGTGR